MSVNGLIIEKLIAISSIPMTMFAAGPAANTASCCFFGAFISFFSSGSTNAPGIIGISTPSIISPEFLTGKLYTLAITPCIPSCITTIMNRLIIQ